MYFEAFPLMLYTLDDGSSAQVVPDIIRRTILSDELKDNNSLFDLYDITEGETPELVSYKMYRDSQYHWIILMTNDMVDPRFDWPLTQVNLVNYCKSKYGEANVYATHHYINSSGYEVNSTDVEATSVSNFAYEEGINENKRRIKILKPEVVSELVSNFDALIKR